MINQLLLVYDCSFLSERKLQGLTAPSFKFRFNNNRLFMLSNIELIHESEEQSDKLSSDVTQTVPFSEYVTCLECYGNMLYVGTCDSRVLTFQMALEQKSKQPISFRFIEDIYPHCSSVKFIEAVEKFIIMIPDEQQQLIRIWQRVPLRIMHGFRGHAKQITKVIFLADKVHLASSSHDGSVRIWDIFDHGQSNKQKWKYAGQFPLLTLAEIDDQNLMFGGDECYITIWNWRREEVKCNIFAHPGSVLSLSFYSPYVISSGGDSKIKIWQIRHKLKSKKAQMGYLEDEQLTELYLAKEIKDRLRHNQFCFDLWKQKMLLLDSYGDLFFFRLQFAFKDGQGALGILQGDYQCKVMEQLFAVLLQWR